MRTQLAAVFLLTVFFCNFLMGYKAKPVKPKPALEYPAHQDFQNLVIAAHPLTTEELAEEFFDTDRLHESRVLAVLIVIENKNDFAVGLREENVHLILGDGTQIPPAPYFQVVASISAKRPLSSVESNPEALARRIRNRDMLEDFEQKSLGEKLIAPHSSDHGFVFFPAPEDLKNARLYLPEVYNITEGEPLIFFEFELVKD